MPGGRAGAAGAVPNPNPNPNPNPIPNPNPNPNPIPNPNPNPQVPEWEAQASVYKTRWMAPMEMQGFNPETLIWRK